jgi:hypothetical protein
LVFVFYSYPAQPLGVRQLPVFDTLTDTQQHVPGQHRLLTVLIKACFHLGRTMTLRSSLPAGVSTMLLSRGAFELAVTRTFFTLMAAPHIPGRRHAARWRLAPRRSSCSRNSAAMRPSSWTGMIVAFALLAASGLGLNFRVHRSWGPTIVGAAGVLAVLYALLGAYDWRIEASGFIALLGAALWDRHLFRRALNC